MTTSIHLSMTPVTVTGCDIGWGIVKIGYGLFKIVPMLTLCNKHSIHDPHSKQEHHSSGVCEPTLPRRSPETPPPPPGT